MYSIMFVFLHFVNICLYNKTQMEKMIIPYGVWSRHIGEAFSFASSCRKFHVNHCFLNCVIEHWTIFCMMSKLFVAQKLHSETHKRNRKKLTFIIICFGLFIFLTNTISKKSPSSIISLHQFIRLNSLFDAAQFQLEPLQVSPWSKTSLLLCHIPLHSPKNLSLWLLSMLREMEFICKMVSYTYMESLVESGVLFGAFHKQNLRIITWVIKLGK